MSKLVNKGIELRTTKKIYNGVSQTFSVYAVDIDELYYNDQNGRIATYISEYDSTHDDKISSLSREELNDTIMTYIKQSESSDSFKKTKENIRNIGQMEVGVILEDGRVIDGNRRFTCLRDLYNETKDLKFHKFECIILPNPTTDSERRAIKSYELAAQYGTDEKVDYSPIDRLVDIYRDLIAPNHYFQEKEYLQRVNNMIKPNELKLMINKAKTLYEYLEFIGKPNRWDIARDEKLDGPIQEIANLRKKIEDNEEEWNKVKVVLFSQLKIIEGDRTREMRNLIKIYNKNPSDFDEISNNYVDIVIKETESQFNKDTQNNEDSSIEEMQANINKKINSSYNAVKMKEAKAKQLKVLEDMYDKISNIDQISIKLSSSNMKKDILHKIEDIEKLLNNLKELTK